MRCCSTPPAGRAPRRAQGLAAALLLLLLALPAAAVPPRVLRCPLSGTVDAGSAAWLQSCVTHAEQTGAAALLVTLDTPGGALEATRQVVRAFLSARVPVLVWVGPPGARAGSAGLFLVLASHRAGMAPGTNVGAAHPVLGPTGQDPEAAGGETMAQKVEEDTVAFAEAVARERGRNVAWAARAVRESASAPAERARALGVVEVLAPTEEAFLAALEGQTVQLPQGEVRLALEGAQLEALSPSPRQRLVHWLASPAVAYLLFVVGTLGLALELAAPGHFVSGVVGVVCLTLALVAFSALPVQTGAVVLLLLGAGLLVAELFVTSGLLGLAGVVLLVLGGVLLVDRVDARWFVEPSFGVPLRFLLPTALVGGGLALLVVWRVAQARRRPQLTGDAGLVGEEGRTLSQVGPEGGEAFVHGELWQAEAPRPIPPGRRVVVRAVRGLTLRVEEATT